MRENMQKIISFVIKEEVNPGEEFTGSYHCAKDDLGGCTKFGIAQKSHPSFDIKNLQREGAIEIYIQEYWKAIEGDTLPAGVDLLVMDFAVTSGPRRALGLYYQVRQTFKPDDFLAAYDGLRRSYYRRIAQAAPSQQANLRDWLIRADHALVAAKALMGGSNGNV